MDIFSGKVTFHPWDISQVRLLFKNTLLILRKILVKNNINRIIQKPSRRFIQFIKVFNNNLKFNDLQLMVPRSSWILS